MQKNSLSPYAIELRGIHKSFGSVAALAGVDLKVKKGSIHAVIGENGAGKSTAMNILYGGLRPDAGGIFVDGRPMEMGSSRDAIKARIGMVHQHFMLAGEQSVFNNLILGHEPRGGFLLPSFLGRIDRKKARHQLSKMMARFSLEPEALDAKVSSLPLGLQQRVEIIKLLYRRARTLILDEPSAVLTPMEVTALIEVLKGLRGEGCTIIVITHKLKEVMELADEVTVFRGGRVVGHKPIAETSVLDLTRMMIGRSLGDLAAGRRQSAGGARELLALEKVDLKCAALKTRFLSDVSFSVGAGEIVGIAGVDGNGQEELLSLLTQPKSFFSETKRARGGYRLLGKTATLLGNEDLRKESLGIVMADRHKQALVLSQSMTDNFLLGHHHESGFQRFGVKKEGALKKAVSSAFLTYDIRPGRADLPCSSFSGGNQQKLVIAREMYKKPKLLLVAQPTRGVDIGAIEFIHSVLLKARSKGTGVLLISSELEELLALADRLLVMYKGRIVAHFNRGQFDKNEIGFYMGGGQK